jgi:capsule polysaccharide export protein KpsE/RkpR
MRNDVRRKLRLDKHYGLDTTLPKFQTNFDYLFEENIKSSLTKYESVELTVLDHDPDTAKLIASAIIESVNKLILKQHLSKFHEFISTNKAYLGAKRKALDSLQQRLTYLSQTYGLLDLNSQLKEASRNYYRLMADGKDNAKLNEVFKNMQNYGPELVTVSNCIREEAKKYAEVENDVEKSIRDFNRKLTYMIVASEPTKPDMKYWPKRGMITFLTSVASFALACFYFAYIHKLKEVFKKMKLSQSSQ